MRQEINLQDLPSRAIEGSAHAARVGGQGARSGSARAVSCAPPPPLTTQRLRDAPLHQRGALAGLPRRLRDNGTRKTWTWLLVARWCSLVVASSECSQMTINPHGQTSPLQLHDERIRRHVGIVGVRGACRGAM